MTKRCFAAVIVLDLTTLSLAYDYVYNPSDFATQVIEYVQGGAVPMDLSLIHI